ncbi:MAG: TlyA family RNA methyltransferase [Thermomicrobiales bacterium]|nr:TlyA family RNA methyltransferase [Thermomicrobiales bacterium]MCO5221672.1 TlyA family RNA methyltransferase [Thermomicrobiales bacterium]
MSQRLDVAMVERGLVPTRSKAQALIMAGVVRVGERTAQKAGEPVGADSLVSIAKAPRFVSRGGEKLDRALTAFGIDLEGNICADIGASTGGFTDVMLQHDAQTVYAIDVGYGQIALELRNDPRVVVMDRTNARYLESLPQPVDFTAIDASFISLSKLFPAVVRISRPGAALVALVKPQFEAGRGEVGKHGVVRDRTVHVRVLHEVIASAAEHDLQLAGLTASPIKGPAGNVEFLGYFLHTERPDPTLDLSAAIDSALSEAPQ